MTLVEFLQARLDWQDGLADGMAFPPPGYRPDELAPLGMWLGEDVAAKRKIIALAEQAEEASNSRVGDDYLMAATYMMDVLKLLALPYADNADYRAEWAA